MNAGLGIWFEPVSFNSFLSEPDKPGTSLSNENFIRIKAIKKGGAADVEATQSFIFIAKLLGAR